MAKILVADASTQSTDLLGHWLKKEGHIVYTADSGYNALAKMNVYTPDIVLANLDLPDMSGFSLCKQIKASKSRALVLCISHLESENNRIRAMDIGADDFMQSGDHYELISKVRNLVRFKEQSDKLRDQYALLEAKDRIMNQQLQMGRNVQRALMPDIDTMLGTSRIVSRYYPAMGVGGDFFSVLPLSQDAFGIVMGDVSGHGIAASFFTVILNMIIKNLTHGNNHSPQELLRRLNNEVHGIFGQDAEMYACVFYAVVQRDRIRFANAGLPLPLLWKRRKNEVHELEARGAPIGLFYGSNYETQTVEYDDGDMLLFYTDGLQDFFYKDNSEEFLKQLSDLMTDWCPRKDMDEILSGLCRNFYKMDATEEERMEMDDMSMLLCKL